jgi:hypothetical protein
MDITNNNDALVIFVPFFVPFPETFLMPGDIRGGYI